MDRSESLLARRGLRRELAGRESEIEHSASCEAEPIGGSPQERRHDRPGGVGKTVLLNESPRRRGTMADRGKVESRRWRLPVPRAVSRTSTDRCARRRELRRWPFDSPGAGHVRPSLRTDSSGVSPHRGRARGGQADTGSLETDSPIWASIWRQRPQGWRRRRVVHRRDAGSPRGGAGGGPSGVRRASACAVLRGRGGSAVAASIARRGALVRRRLFDYWPIGALEPADAAAALTSALEAGVGERLQLRR
jgi:hypothetical protein